MTAMDTANGSLRRRTLLAAAVAAAALGWGSGAWAQPGPVDLAVVDRDTGRELPLWRHHGRLFVAGQPGARYALRVSNHTEGRVLLVLSVDGVNVLSGETASYDQGGYVLAPHDAYDVNGWRKSNAEVAAFTFAPLPQSYAARTGRPLDVGVIGMAVFEERAAPAQAYTPPQSWSGRRGSRSGAGRALPPPPLLAIPSVKAPMRESAAPSSPEPAPPPAQARAATSAPTGAVQADAAPRRADKLGTAHGAREASAVESTTFERATRAPQSTRLIEYDTYSNLVARGVVRAPPYAGQRPRPFPMEPGSGGFVPDPPGAE